MPLRPEQKEGLLGNCSNILELSANILTQLQTTKTPITDHDLTRMHIAATCALSITLGTLATAIIANMEETNIMQLKQ